MGTFLACKKSDQNPNEVKPDYLKAIVEKWQQQFITTASATDQKLADSIISSLDYSSICKVLVSDTTTLYFVRISSKITAATNNYLTISSNNEKYNLDGIYQAKSLRQIETFLQTKKLTAKDSILIYGIDKHPIKGWVANESGKIFPRTGKPTPFGQQVTYQTASIDRSVNLAQSQNPCVNWYWITYDPETEEIVSVQYLYSTGNCSDDGSGGGSGGGNNNPSNNCNMSVTEVEDIFNNLSEQAFTGQGYVTYSEGSDIISPNGGGIRRPRNCNWEFAQVLVNGIGLSYAANFTGTIYTTSYSTPFTWETFGYANTVLASGVLPVCGSISNTTTCSTSIDVDKSAARADLRFDYYVTFSCTTGNMTTQKPRSVVNTCVFYPKN